MGEIERSIDREKRKLAGHNVPQAGSLDQLSYCRDCGDAFNSHTPCPGPDGVDRSNPDARKWIPINLVEV